MIAGGIERDRALLERYSPEQGPGRVRAGLASDYGATWRHCAPRPTSRTTRAPPVVLGPPGAVCSIHGGTAYAAQAGHHLAPQPLSSGNNVFEELGTGFTLLAFGAEDGAVKAFEERGALAARAADGVRDSYEGDRGRTRRSWCWSPAGSSTSCGPVKTMSRPTPVSVLARATGTA